MSGEKSKDGVRRNRERLAQFYGGDGADASSGTTNTTGASPTGASAVAK